MQKNKIVKVANNKSVIELKRQEEFDAIGGGGKKRDMKCRCYCGSEAFGSTFIGLKNNPLDCAYACKPKMYDCK